MITTLRVLRQAGKTDKEICKEIDRVQVETSGKRPEGLFELFCDLSRTGYTDSLIDGRIYCLACLLSNAGIKVRVGYKE